MVNGSGIMISGGTGGGGGTVRQLGGGGMASDHLRQISVAGAGKEWLRHRPRTCFSFRWGWGAQVFEARRRADASCGLQRPRGEHIIPRYADQGRRRAR